MNGLTTKILPFQASNFASEVDWLFFTLVAITVFFTTLVFALVIFLALRYRRSNVNDYNPAQIQRYDPVQKEYLWMELTWTIIPLIIGLGIFFWGADIYLRMYSEPPKGALDVFVTGKQWMWKFQYPDGRRQINVLHVPVGKPVKLTMVSEDVIHSFFIPDFRVKHDVVPMRYTSIWFEATTPGVYPILCSQYCGTNHSAMIGKVYVLPEKEYADWISNGNFKSEPSGAVASGSATGALTPVASGSELFTRLACVTCHLNPQLAPKLEGLYGSKVALITGQQVTADENYIRESILKPTAKVVKGYQPVMPSFQGQISEEELMTLVTYIKNLGKKK